VKHTHEGEATLPPLTPAQRVYGEYLLQGPARRETLKELCAREPELAVELRDVADEWERLLADSTAEPDSADFALKLLGKYEDVLISEEGSTEESSAPAHQVPFIPELPRYELHGEVGRGGMGVVYRAVDRNLARPLAMKVVLGTSRSGSAGIPPSVSPARLRRFLAEAQITGQLDHPGIVPVHELGIDAADRVYFTMPLVRGRELGEIFRLAHRQKDGWSLTSVLGVLVRVGETVAYAHSHGVVHRDLKPSNVLVGEHGEVYVMDWGLARATGCAESRDLRIAISSERESGTDGGSQGSSPLQTRDGTVLGTPAYMSPEQALGLLEELGPRTDVYALGALLYTGLTGRAPHEAPRKDASPLDLLEKIAGSDPVPVAELEPESPPELIAICEKAMARDPALRYADPQEMVEDLRAFLAGRVVRAHDSGAWTQLEKWFSRNRLFAASISVGILSLVTFFVVRSILTTIHAATLRELGDSYLLEQLVNEARNPHGWVVHPSRIEKMKAWREQATGLEERLPDHERRLEELERQLPENWNSPHQLEHLAREEIDLIWEYKTRESYVERATEFTGNGGLLEGVCHELEWAGRVREESILDHAERWREAIEAIAASDQYGGLRIGPQLGLVPIGFDPESKLAEFAHLRTARREIGSNGEPGLPFLPRTDPSQPLDPTEDLPLIFVLIPGNTARIGAVPPAPDNPEGHPHVDRYALSGEAPIHEVVLRPFFISKYEMTQGQYERLASPVMEGAHEPSDSAPFAVVDLNWSGARDLLWRCFLTLPSEARWEYSCRAGTTTIWHTGDDEEELRTLANLKGTYEDDRFEAAAPVGSFPPNRFGLHDVHGNVAEHCLDAYGTYFLVPEPSTGRRFPWTGEGCVRGGSYDSRPCRARSAWRGDHGASGSWVGLRPARPLFDSESSFE